MTQILGIEALRAQLTGRVPDNVFRMNANIKPMGGVEPE